MKVRVERHSFHKAPLGGHHRFSEYSPEAPPRRPFECNCTKTVTSRPSAPAHQVQQIISLEGEHQKYQVDIRFDSRREGPWITFRWPGPKDGWVDRAEPDRTHAYFIMDVNGKKNSLSVEIVLPGYGRTDCFFGHLYFGNQVDVSTLMNGHAPSNIIDLSKIRPNQVWAHECRSGKEAMTFLREGGETEGWRTLKLTATDQLHAMRPYQEDLHSSVDEIREGVQANEKILTAADIMKVWLAHIVTNLKDTELFRSADEVSRFAELDLPKKR